MNDLFNTPFEIGLRILLALYAIHPKAATLDRLTAYDFISVYGKDFGVTENSLNGINSFNFSELSTRRGICSKGIKEFALDGLIDVQQSKTGFKYKISKAGKVFVEALDSDYAKQYTASVSTVNKIYGDKSDTALVSDINNKAVQSLRR